MIVASIFHGREVLPSLNCWKLLYGWKPSCAVMLLALLASLLVWVQREQTDMSIHILPAGPCQYYMIYKDRLNYLTLDSGQRHTHSHTQETCIAHWQLRSLSYFSIPSQLSNFVPNANQWMQCHGRQIHLNVIIDIYVFVVFLSWNPSHNFIITVETWIVGIGNIASVAEQWPLWLKWGWHDGVTC